MRRKAALLLTVFGLLTGSALGASTAVANPGGTIPTHARTTVPAGWERVDSATLDRSAGRTDRSGPLTGTAPVLPLHWLQSASTGRAVASERNYQAPYNGLLRARSEKVDLWELYDIYLLDEETGAVALNSHANGLYVAPELSYSGAANGLLRARSEKVASWERFFLYYNENTDRYALQSAVNELFVSTENGYAGDLRYALRARSASIGGSWEEFYLIDSQSA